MYITAVGMYVPSARIHNDYFLSLNGLSDEWIHQRTGIRTRSKAGEGEDGNSMAFCAVDNALMSLSHDVGEIDFIVSAGYSPLDTAGTLGHRVQQKYNMNRAKVVMLSSACSSFINACETVEAFFQSGKATKALVVCSEQNSYYSNETDPKAGHLWGDAAVAVFFSKEQLSSSHPKVTGIVTHGLGLVGKGPEGVYLKPKNEGIQMPDGRDVFVHATHEMISALSESLANEGMTLNDLTYASPHQANMRIIKTMARQIDLPMEKVLTNIEELGNTGSPSCMLATIQCWNRFKKGDVVGLTVFGAGYSSGAMLIRF